MENPEVKKKLVYTRPEKLDIREITTADHIREIYGRLVNDPAFDVDMSDDPDYRIHLGIRHGPVKVRYGFYIDSDLFDENLCVDVQHEYYTLRRDYAFPLREVPQVLDIRFRRNWAFEEGFGKKCKTSYRTILSEVLRCGTEHWELYGSGDDSYEFAE
jgi:hypothetical protein